MNELILSLVKRIVLAQVDINELVDCYNQHVKEQAEYQAMIDEANGVTTNEENKTEEKTSKKSSK